MPDIPISKELLESIAKQNKSKREGFLRLLGKSEWEKCREDIFYWLDASRHAGIPYVYTQDPHPMYVCKTCADGNTHTFSKLPDHLLRRHDILEAPTPLLRSSFTELPSTRAFPLYPYMIPIIEAWLKYPLLALEKSRDMMATWLVVMMYTWDTLFHEGRQNIFQSDDSTKTAELVERAEFIAKHQPKFLRNYTKSTYTMGQSRSGVLSVANESQILGFPQGPDQIRQYHPSGIFLDEAAFQIEAGEAFAAIKPSIQNGGRCTMVSTANPSYFMHLARDTSDTITEG